MHPQSIIATVLTIGFTVFALKLIADAQDAAREEQVFGDVIEVPAAARNDAGGERKIRSDRLAQGTMDRTHVGTGL